MTPLAVSTFMEVLLAMLVAVPVILLWIAAVADVVGNKSHSRRGVKVAAVLVLILILPILGPLLYFVFRPGEPEDVEAARLAQEDLRREAARRPVGGSGVYR